MPAINNSMQKKISTTMREYPQAKGIAVIIYNTYNGNLKLKGTVKDGDAMYKTFEALDFAPIRLPDAGRDEIYGIIEALCSYPNFPERYTCFAVTFSGHGKEDVIIGNDGNDVDLEKAFLRPLNELEATLIAGVPKLIFIDACRGKHSGTVHATGPTCQPPNNVLLAYSTKQGNVAYEMKTGSCWMQLLAKELRVSHEPVNVVLTNVNKMVDNKWQEPAILNNVVDIILNPAPKPDGKLSAGYTIHCSLYSM
jgi:hypothetical protein